MNLMCEFSTNNFELYETIIFMVFCLRDKTLNGKTLITKLNKCNELYIMSHLTLKYHNDPK